MHRFFVEEKENPGNPLEENSHVWIDGEDGKHLSRVLRLDVGDRIQVVINQQEEWIGEIIEVDKKRTKVLLKELKIEERESSIQITLYQGVAKAQKMETVIQKSVELGVNRVVPVMTRRSVVELKNDKDREKKRERWQKIAYEAAKQSKRIEVPEILIPVSFEDAVGEAENEAAAQSLVAYEEERNQSLKQVLREGPESCSRYALWIGPEGGFEEQEIEVLKTLGVRPVSLGKRILRTETAAVALIAVLQYEKGDLGGEID